MPEHFDPDQPHDRDFEASLTEPLIRLGKDIKKAAEGLNARNARWLVDMYYTIQQKRIRAEQQDKSHGEGGEPQKLISWVFLSMERFEQAMAGALDSFSMSYRVGQWMQSQTGVGKVIAAALLCHFDIRQAPTVGHWWRYCGADGSCLWPSSDDAKSFVKSEADKLVNLSVEPEDLLGIYYDALRGDLPVERGDMRADAKDAIFARTLLDNHSPRMLRAMLPMAARVANRENKQQPFSDVLMEDEMAMFAELCAEHDVSPTCDGDEIGIDVVRACAEKFGRNVYRLAKAAVPRDRDTQEVVGPMTVKSLSAALARRPWNARLKTISIFKLGESFVKFQNHPKCFYGHLFADKKRMFQDFNVEGKYAEEALREKETCKKSTEKYKWNSGQFRGEDQAAAVQAERALKERLKEEEITRAEYKKLYKDLKAETLHNVGEGNGTPMLSPQHIHDRARRWVAKLFISHFHDVCCREYFGKPSPDPYCFNKPELGHHSHRIEIPNWPAEGLTGRPLSELYEE